MAAETTEFHDILVQKGILPPRKEAEVTEEQIIGTLDSLAQQKLASFIDEKYADKSIGELDDMSGDDEEEKVILEYRRKRIQEIQQRIREAKFGDVREISAENYVTEVNKAGPGVWVLLLLYETSSTLCRLLQEHWQKLAPKFPASKFLKSEAHLCVPNFPAKNLPAVFIYYEDQLVRQLVGNLAFTGSNGKSPINVDELEWKISETGAIKSELKENPALRRQKFSGNGILLRSKDQSEKNQDSSEDDW